MKVDDDKYIDPETFSIYLSPKPNKYDLSDEKYLVDGNIKINEQMNIDDFIPKVCQISIPLTEKKISYVFYTNTQIQTVYEDSMKGRDHKNENTRILYATHNNKINETKIIYIKIFGAKQELNFRIESTDSEIYYDNNSKRLVKVLSQQHLKCDNSFYYIGSYTFLAEDTNFYLEEIYGKYKVYYRNSITNSEDDTILTNGDEKYLIDSITGPLSKTFDIIELKCESPGYFNLHLLKSYFTKTLTMYKREVAFVQKGKIYIYPKPNEGQKNIFLEISTPLGKEVKIKEKDSDYVINEDNKYFQINYPKEEDVPQSLSLSVTEDNTLLSIKITDSSLYQVVETNRSRVNEERVLFKLDNKQDYKNINITLKRVFYDYAYTIFRGDINYAIDPILSGYETKPIVEYLRINFILSNPYIKANSMKPDKENSPFYIMFYVNDPDGIQKDAYMEYMPAEEYKAIPNSVSNVLSISKDKYKLDIEKDVSKVSVLYQSCEDTLKGVDIYSYDDILNTYDINTKNKYNLGVFNNYLIPKQIGPIFENGEGKKYTGAIIGISLNEISQDEINQLNSKDYNITQKGKKIKWEGLEGVKEYTAFVFNENNEELKYIKNPCFLDYIQKKNISSQQLMNENDTSYIAHYSAGTNNELQLNENGTFIVTVMADLEGKMPLKFIYNEFKFNSSAQPDDDDDGNNTLLIVFAIILPLVFLSVIFLIICFVRKKKDEINVSDTRSTKLINDSRSTLSFNQ